MSLRLVTFTLDEHTYGVDVVAVQEVLRDLPRTRIPLAAPALAGLANLRGQVLTVIDPRVQLALPERSEGGEPMLIVIRSAVEPVALLVDAIGSVVDADPAQFETPPATLTGGALDLIRGAYKLPGQLLLSLDVDRALRDLTAPT